MKQLEINPAIGMPNGTQQKGFEVLSDGRVYVVCADGVLRQVHPAVVAAFGSGRIAPGVWQVACYRMANPSATGIILPPTAFRER
jgi:hypothetical protein